MKTGDKVVFLNDIGGGIIVGFPDNKTVSVRDETGFDIPMLRSEVVVVEAKDDTIGGKKTSNNCAIHQTEHKHPLATPQHIENKLNLSLGYIRNMDTHIGIQTYELYIINDSDYYAQFLLAEHIEKDIFLRHTDVIEPHTKLYLETFDEQHISSQEHLLFQSFFYQTSHSFLPKKPVSINIHTEGARFIKANTFKTNPFFETPALIIPLITDDTPIHPLKVDAELLTEKIQDNKRKKNNFNKKKTKEQQLTDILEIDLHADQLLSTTIGMEAKDILDYQLQVVRDTMQKYHRHRNKRIVFIHGKGNGILRNAVTEFLKRHYPTCKYQDADFQEYGFGATMVRIS